MNKKKLSILSLGVLIAGMATAQQKHRANPSVKTSKVAVQGFNYKTKAEETYKNINSYFTDRKTGLYFETTDTVHRENIHSWLWHCVLWYRLLMKWNVYIPERNIWNQ